MNTTIYYGIVLVVMTMAIVTSVTMWAKEVKTFRRQQTISDRLTPLINRTGGLVKDELEIDFYHRIVEPFFQRISKGLADRLLPSRVNEELNRRLKMAGAEYSASTYVLIRLVSTVLAAAVTVIAVTFVHSLTLLQKIALPFVVAGVVYLLFGTRLTSKYQKRMEQLEDSLPEVFDILSVSIEAGLAFDGALRRLVQKTSGVVQQEFGRVLTDLQVGMTREQALRGLAERTKSAELNRFASLVAQSDKTGGGIGTALHIQGERIKEIRVAKAREKAASLPVKMMFPMVLFIFPSLFVAILGPGLLSILKAI
jgi:tight adherence protein C